MDAAHIHAIHTAGTLATALIPLCIFSFVVKAVYDVYFHPLRHIPGPKINAISRIPYVRHHLAGTVVTHLRQLHEKYGEVVRYSPNELSFISNETAWTDIYGFRTGRLHGHANMQKDKVWFPPPENGVPSIVIANDEDHSRGRRILAHAFSEKALAGQETLLQNYADQLIDRLKETISVSNAPVNMAQWFNWLTFDVISDLLFGEPFGCLQTLATHRYVDLLIGTIRALRFYYVMFHFPVVKYLGSLIVSKAEIKSRKEFATWVADHIKIRCERDTARPDFMTEILKRNETNSKDALSEKEMVSNAILFLGAGTETTATTLSAATYLLCINPRVLSKLQDEIRGRWKNYYDITLEQVNTAPYLFAVLSESLRIFPPIPTGVLRKVGAGGEIVSGYYIPENTSLCVSSHAAHHSARNFTDPDEFVPERWMDDKRYANDKREWVQPFSYGPRNCLGKNLAYAEMRLFLAKLVWTFDFELDESSRDWMDKCRVMLVWQKPELHIKLKEVERE